MVDKLAASVQPVVCVFCASSRGHDPTHLDSARRLSNALAEAGYRLVYGGGTMGIMGEVAKTFVSRSGPKSVEGIIPRALVKVETDPSLIGQEGNGAPVTNGSTTDTKQHERNISPGQLKRTNTADAIPADQFGQTTIVMDMHTRKRTMAERVSDGGPGSGFVALAGGYGTLEEVMEMVTWNQLGIHKLPIVLVNINGYWDGLLNWVRNSIDEGFVGQGNANIIMEVKRPEDVVEALQSYRVAKGRFNLDWSTKK